MKVIGKPKDFGDIWDAWKMLVEKIGPVRNDFVIFSIKQRKQIRYFHARVAGNYIVVDRAKEHVETAQINRERRIDFNQLMKKEYKGKRSYDHESPLPLVAPTFTGAYNTVHTATPRRASAQIRRRRTSYAPKSLSAMVPKTRG